MQELLRELLRKELQCTHCTLENYVCVSTGLWRKWKSISHDKPASSEDTFLGGQTTEHPSRCLGCRQSFCSMFQLRLLPCLVYAHVSKYMIEFHDVSACTYRHLVGPTILLFRGSKDGMA